MNQKFFSIGKYTGVGEMAFEYFTNAHKIISVAQKIISEGADSDVVTHISIIYEEKDDDKKVS